MCPDTLPFQPHVQYWTNYKTQEEDLMLFLPTLETVLLGGSISPGKSIRFMICESLIVYFCRRKLFSLAVRNQQCLQNIRIPEK